MSNLEDLGGKEKAGKNWEDEYEKVTQTNVDLEKANSELAQMQAQLQYDLVAEKKRADHLQAALKAEAAKAKTAEKKMEELEKKLNDLTLKVDKGEPGNSDDKKGKKSDKAQKSKQELKEKVDQEMKKLQELYKPGISIKNGYESLEDQMDNDSESSSDSGDSSGSLMKRRHKKRKNKFTCIVDNNGVKIPKFNINGDKKWGKFIKDFEKKCENRYPNDKERWVQELGEALQGEIKIMFTNYGGVDESYRVIKNKLTEYADRKKPNSVFEQAKFTAMTMERGETPISYAARLETVFRREYPSENHLTSSTLLRKFLETTPHAIGLRIKQNYHHMKNLSGEEPNWNIVQDWIMQQEQEMDQTSGARRET